MAEAHIVALNCLFTGESTSAPALMFAAQARVRLSVLLIGMLPALWTKEGLKMILMAIGIKNSASDLLRTGGGPLPPLKGGY